MFGQIYQLNAVYFHTAERSMPGDLTLIFLAYRTDFMFPSKKVFQNNLTVEGFILTANVEGVDAGELNKLAEPVVTVNEKNLETAVVKHRVCINL